jgi:TolB-like protein
MGDGALVEFASVVDAVTCAVEVQRKLAARNANLPENERLEFRIGVNIGDVMVDGDDIYGDGVNLAARLEALAGPGGVMVSEAVVTQTSHKVAVGFEDLGAQRLKNISEPVRVFRVLLDNQAPFHSLVSRRRGPLAAIVVVLLVASVYAAWNFTLGPGSADVVDFDEQEMLLAPIGPTIAVMPFENLSGDAESDYLATGISEDIIVELGRYKDVNAISRQSVAAYKGKVADVRQIGRDLGADYLLEGTVRQSSDRLRVTASLIDATRGSQVWSSAFNETLTTASIFDVQLSITERVASAVGDAGGAIKRIHIRDARAKPPDKLSSYECSLYRVGFFDRPDLQDRVSRCILRVVKEEPGYWRGWVMLAEALRTDVMLFSKRYEGAHEEKLERAAEAAREAISLNPDSPRAQYELAMALLMLGDREGFNAAAEAALSLGGDRHLEGEIGYQFVWAGRHEFGAALLRRAIELDPASAEDHWHQALAEHHFLEGDYEAALVEYKKGAQPHYWWSVALEVAILTKLGRTGAALQARDRLFQLRPGIKIADIVWVYRRFQRPDVFMIDYVDAFRVIGIPDGQFRPLDAGESS